MKKIFGVFLALLLGTGAFAADPVADLSVAEFDGSASVTFGVDLNTGLTGFKNENEASIKFNLFSAGDKSTIGSGIWGELKVTSQATLIGPDGITIEDEDEPAVEVETAILHFGPVYMGIKSLNLAFDGFTFPHAVGSWWGYGDWQGDISDLTIQSFNENFNNGIVLGFKNEMVKVEASLKSRPGLFKSVSTELIKAESVEVGSTSVTGDSATWTSKGDTYITPALEGIVYSAAGPTVTVDYDDDKREWVVKGQGTIIKLTYMPDDDSIFWSNNFAIGGLVELTLITDLKISVAANYLLSDEKLGDAGDMGLYAGIEYKFPIGDKFFIKPVIAYSMAIDASKKAGVLSTDGGNGDLKDAEIVDGVSVRKNKYDNSMSTGRGGWDAGDSSSGDSQSLNRLGLSLRFGWGETTWDTGLLTTFFGEKLILGDGESGYLSPGISVLTVLDLGSEAQTSEEAPAKNMDTYLPILVTAYSGEIVPNLNVSALFYNNIAKKLNEISGSVTIDAMLKKLKAEGGDPMQIGLAASYAIAAGDITITPALGLLFASTKMTSTSTVVSDVKEGSVTSFDIDLKVDIAGLVPNTTFTVAWDNGSFANIKAGDKEHSIHAKGGVSVTAKIHF